MSNEVKSEAPLTASERLALLRREARKHRVGEIVKIAGETLLRIDARRGKHHHRWGYPVEQKKNYL